MPLSGGGRCRSHRVPSLTGGRRRCGLGSRIVEAAVDAAKTKLHADTITIEAQTYARALYERCGFRQTSEEFLEDGIPHIQMQLKL